MLSKNDLVLYLMPLLQFCSCQISISVILYVYVLSVYTYSGLSVLK